jgi:DNA helicase-2/ATP-dependent DNA helicase PcrA
MVKTNLVDVDKKIFEYLDSDNPKSFILFAGAGAGKTRTLVNVLEAIKDFRVNQLIHNGNRVAVITYTNAACDEIKERLNHNPIFEVSTIHSFAWSLIKPFTQDIKLLLVDELNAKIVDLQGKIAKARDKNGKGALTNQAKLTKSRDRLTNINTIKEFIYSPIEILTGKGALNHEEVLKFTSALLLEKPLLQKLLVSRYPVLLIDESQDTKKQLLEAFMNVQTQHKSEFSLGIIGDLMQSIYNGGKSDILESLPDDWEILEKKVNYRSPKRIIKLINDIRAESDGWKQEPSLDEEGFVRLFIVNANVQNKQDIEAKIKKIMCEVTNDSLWETPPFNHKNDLLKETVKCLTLEHAMAAIRGGFSDFFLPLLGSDKLKDDATKGTRKEFVFICKVLIPFIVAVMDDDKFGIMKLLKKYSDNISDRNIYFHLEPLDSLIKTKKIVHKFKQLLEQGGTTLFDVMSFLEENYLLDLPEEFIPIISGLNSSNINLQEDEDSELSDKVTLAWQGAFRANINQVINYEKYITGNLGFATHQGVKGLEFDRVMAILDDQESKGFLFKYDKLFGAEPLTATDLKNEKEGLDSSVSRTRRLFYVICSRAQKSLAVVAYTKDPLALKKKANQTWFNENEIIML